MIIIEQALHALVQALRFNQNVNAMCIRWWAVSASDCAANFEVINYKNSTFIRKLINPQQI